MSARARWENLPPHQRRAIVTTLQRVLVDGIVSVECGYRCGTDDEDDPPYRAREAHDVKIDVDQYAARCAIDLLEETGA